MSRKVEFSDGMFEDFHISEYTENKQAAWCVWTVVGFDAPTEEIKRVAKIYQTTYENVMKWKLYFMKQTKK